MRKRQRCMLDAMLAAANDVGVKAVAVRAHTGRAHVAMTWGMGHLGRRAALQQHMRKGGHVVGWDLGYWLRDRHYRLTIDKDHPPSVLPDMPGTRLAAQAVMLREDYDAAGPIVLVGFGKKSRDSLALRGMEWEERTFHRLRHAYPHARIVYRPKRPEPFKLCPAVEGDIQDVLRGASLVVCNHSNVAIDACIAGIPVVCSDGAAAALYNDHITNPFHATRQQRLSFLQRLAWWQWDPNEAKQAWLFITQQTCD